MRFTRMLVLGVAVVGMTTLSAAGSVTLFVDAYAQNCDPESPLLGTQYPLGPCATDPDAVPPVEPGDVCTWLPITSGECMTPTAKAMYEIFFSVAVGVDPLQGHPTLGNKGLATIVYDVMPNDCMTCGCPDVYFNQMQDADSGWSDNPVAAALRQVSAGMYVDSGTTAYAGYNGGWGFDNAGLATGGNTDTVQELHGAGMLAPLAWDADVNPTYAGLQPYVRQGVGHGTYTFPAEDPIVGGMQGGFGQVLDNAGTGGPVLPGDGKWLLQRGTIDTSLDGARGNWDAGTYDFDIDPSVAAVYSPTIDYNFDVGGGFRIAIPGGEMVGDSFSFTLIPEPTTLGVLVLGAVGMVVSRRRR